MFHGKHSVPAPAPATDFEAHPAVLEHTRASTFHVNHQLVIRRPGVQGYVVTVSRMLARKASTSASVVSKAAIHRTTD